jgi:hypothetical protein
LVVSLFFDEVATHFFILTICALRNPPRKTCARKLMHKKHKQYRTVSIIVNDRLLRPDRTSFSREISSVCVVVITLFVQISNTSYK